MFENLYTDYWKVLSLFIIPFGGGIPAGVLMAKSLKIAWPITTVLYFISDLLLAITFEPLLKLVIHFGRKNETVVKMGHLFKQSIELTTQKLGTNTGPLSLVAVAFGVDPMTGRTVAVIAGHGFLTGWMIAIAGDMLYFGVIMMSTLWLNQIIGDSGVITNIIIILLMIFFPRLIQYFREQLTKLGWKK